MTVTLITIILIMKKLLIFLSALILTLMRVDLCAQKKRYRQCYEILNEEKIVDKALDLVSKQLEDTPDNVDAMVLRM